MKIGLVRHFKVNHPFPKQTFITKSNVIEWFEKYDKTTDLAYKDVDLEGVEWERCYSSTMLRAINTANHIYQGEILQKAELQELNILHRLPNKVKLPFIFWGIMVRLKSTSSNKDTDEFKNNIIAFVDELISNKENNTLIVSHWFVMEFIRQELIKRGFTGSTPKSNEYGKLYIYECKDN